jgi:hypothetical protein
MGSCSTYERNGRGAKGSGETSAKIEAKAKILFAMCAR